MINYNKFWYMYPPRPKNAIPSEDLNFYDNGSMLGQIKCNGSNCLIFMNENHISVWNRHNSRLTNFNLDENEIRSLYRGNGWMVINGEYMNKSKRGVDGQVFNNKLIVFDILVYNSEYLVGETFSRRVEMVYGLWDLGESDIDFMNKISENCYLIKSYQNGFNNLFDKWTGIDMVEGLVLKRSNAKLEIGGSENNNTKTQLKSRKKTKLYQF